MYKSIATVLLVIFGISSCLPVQAQPAPVVLMNSHAPVLLGVRAYPQNPFRFDFILDRGDRKDAVGVDDPDITRLVKYFLAALTIPGKDLWVNLSPYEKDRIMPHVFANTGMGRDVLEQDYLLKRLVADFVSPDSILGKKFWEVVYQRMRKEFGTTDIPLDMRHKVWIVADKSQVSERGSAAYVTQARLKVMLDSDRVAMSHQKNMADSSDSAGEVAQQVMREVIIPEIEREINKGRDFELLRQAHRAIILAQWYRQKIKGIIGEVYADRGKTAGIDVNPREAEEIWQEYVRAFQQGRHDMVREDQDPMSGATWLRKYSTGGVSLLIPQGIDFAQLSPALLEDQMSGIIGSGRVIEVAVSILPVNEPQVTYSEFRNMSLKERKAFSGEIQFWPLRKDGGLHIYGRTLWSSYAGYTDADKVNILSHDRRVIKVFDSQGRMLYPYGTNLIYPGSSFEEDKPPLYQDGVLDTKKGLFRIIGKDFSGVIDMYPLENRGGCLFLNQYLTSKQLKMAGVGNDEVKDVLKRLTDAGYIDKYQSVSRAFRGLEGEWGDRKKALEKQLMRSRNGKYPRRMNGFENTPVRIRVEEGEIIEMTDISVSRKDLEAAGLSVDAEKVFHLVRERQWAHPGNEVRFVLRPEMNIDSLKADIELEFGRKDAQVIGDLLIKARQGKPLVPDLDALQKFKGSKTVQAVKLLLLDVEFIDGLRRLSKADILQHIIRTVNRMQIDFDSKDTASILKLLRQHAPKELAVRIPVASISLGSLNVLINGLDAVQDDLDSEDFLRIPAEQKTAALVDILSRRGFVVQGSLRDVWRAFPLTISPRVRKSMFRLPGSNLALTQQIIALFDRADFLEYINSDAFFMLGCEDRLAELYRKAISLGLNISTQDFVYFHSLLPDAIGVRLKRKDIQIVFGTLEDFDQVRAAIADTRMQAYLDGHVLWQERQFMDAEPEERIALFVEYARHIGFAIESDYLASVYTRLPQRLSKNVFKKDFRRIEASLGMFRRMYAVIIELTSREHIDRMDESDGDGLMAYIEQRLSGIEGIRWPVVWSMLPKSLRLRVEKNNMFKMPDWLAANFMSTLSHRKLLEHLESREFRRLDGGMKFVSLVRKMQSLGCPVDHIRLEAVFRFLPESVGGVVKKDFYRVLGYVSDFEKVREILAKEEVQQYLNSTAFFALDTGEKLANLFEFMLSQDDSLRDIDLDEFYTMLPPWLSRCVQKKDLFLIEVSLDDFKTLRTALHDDGILEYVNNDTFKRMGAHNRLPELVARIEAHGYRLENRQFFAIHTALPPKMGQIDKKDIRRVQGTASALEHVRSLFVKGILPAEIHRYMSGSGLVPGIYIEDLMKILQSAGLDKWLRPRLVYDALPEDIRKFTRLQRIEYRINEHGILAARGKKGSWHAYNFRNVMPGIAWEGRQVVPLLDRTGRIGAFHAVMGDGREITIRAVDARVSAKADLQIVTQYKKTEVWEEVVDSSKSVEERMVFQEWMGELEDIIRTYDDADRLVPDYLDFLVALLEMQHVRGMSAAEILDAALEDSRLSVARAEGFLKYLLSGKLKSRGVHIDRILSGDIVEYLRAENPVTDLPDASMAVTPGGVDLQEAALQVEIVRHSEAFDVAGIRELVRESFSEDFDGFRPVILGVSVVNDVAALDKAEGI